MLKTGLWSNNVALVQLLGLCPLLAVSNSLVNSLGLGAATLVVVASSNLLVSLLRRYIPDAIRLPVFVLLIASLTTCTELIIQAFAIELYQTLGIFLPLIVTNCMILGQAEGFAARNPPLRSLANGLVSGLGFALVLALLGSLRELIGTGAMGAGLHLLFGELGSQGGWRLMAPEQGFLLALLPPGAFIGLGLLIAARNLIDYQIERRLAQRQAPIAGARRVRVTGKIL